MKFFCLLPVMLGYSTATLTSGGTVTAVSYDPATPASRVIDGSFAFSDTCTNCAGCFSTLAETGAAWINVKLANPARIKTVVLVNNEEATEMNNLVGSEIRVGFNALPQNNALCSSASSSGLFTCPSGTQGLYVGIYNANMNGKSLKLCELRAYPWIANQFVATMTVTNEINGFPPANALSFTDNLVNDLMTKNNKQIDGRYEFNLSDTKFVYATILIGDPQSDFKNTKEWYVTAGTGLSLANPSVTTYQTEQDRFGLETVIGRQASRVAFIRSTGTEQFNVVFGGVFAASIDCSTIILNWTNLGTNSPYRYSMKATPATEIINLDPGTDATCFLFMKVTLADDSAVPAFMTVNIANRRLEIVPSLPAHKGTYNLKVFASYWDNVSPFKSATETFQVIIFCADTITLNPATQISSPQIYTIGDNEVFLNVPAYTFTPLDAQVNFVYTLSGAPSFVTIVGNQIRIQTSLSSHKGVYPITVGVRETISGLTHSTAFSLTAQCDQSFTQTTTQANVFYVVGSAAIVKSLPPYTVVSACPPSIQYTLKQENGSALPAGLVFNPDPAILTLTILSTDNTLSATFSLVLKISDTGTQQFNDATKFTVKIYCIQGLQPSSAFAPITYVIDPLNPTPQTQASPLYVGTPAECLETLQYSLALAKISAPLDPFLTFSQAAGITISTGDITYVGDYNYKFVATDTVSGAVSADMLFTISLVCRPSQLSLTSGKIQNQTYTLASAQIVLPVPSYTSAPASCVYQSALAMSLEDTASPGTLPSFISPAAPTANVIISTSEITFAQLTFTFKFKAQVAANPTIADEFTFQVSLVCDVTALNVITQFPGTPYTYLINPSASTQYMIVMPVYKANPACSQTFNYAISGNPSFITINAPNLVVETTDISKAGSYTFTLSATEPISSISDKSQTFQLRMRCSTAAFSFSTTLSDMNYSITNSTATQELPEMSINPVICKPDIVFQIQNIDGLSTPWISPINPFFLVQGENISVYTMDSSAIGLYNFRLVTFDLTGAELASTPFKVVIKCSVLQIVVVSGGVINPIKYKVSQDPIVYQTFKAPTYTWQPQSCAANLQTQVLHQIDNLTSNLLPSFITWNGETQEVKIGTDDVSLVGIYNFKLKATETSSNVSNDEIKFTVTMICQITDLSPIIDNQTFRSDKFIIGEQMSFTIPKYEVQPKSCEAGNLFYKLEGSEIPSFISLDSATKQIKLSGGTENEGRKDYQFTIVASKDGFENSSYSFTISSKIHKYQVLQDVTFAINDKKYPSWNLESENNEIAPQSLLKMGNAKDWLIFDKSTFSISSSASIEPGTFPISVTLTDSADSSITYSFKINVEPVPEEEEVIEKDDEEETSELEIVLEKPNEAAFAEPYVFKDGTQVYTNKDGTILKIEPLTAVMTKVDIKGQFKVKFSDLVFKQFISYLKDEKFINVDITWKNADFDAQEIPKPAYTWKALNMTNEFIELKVDFEEPLQISQGKQPDILNVYFKKRTQFRRRTDGESLNENSILLSQPIPKQAPNIQEAVRIEETLDQFKGISGTTLFILAFYGLMNLPKSLFWSLHGTIQFIVYEPQHGGNFPGNVQFMYDLLNKLANMTFDKAQEWNRKIFNVKLPEGTNNVFVDAGIFLFAILALGIAILLFFVIRKPLSKCSWGRYLDDLMATEIRRTLMFSSPLRFAQLVYMFIVVKSWSVVADGKLLEATDTESDLMRAMQSTGNATAEQESVVQGASKGQKANAFIFYMLFVYSIIYPICVTAFLMFQGPVGLARHHIIEKFRSLYLDLRLTSRWNLMITVNFLLRRAIVGMSIALLDEHYGFQLIILIVTCSYISLYDMLVMPFNSVQLNVVELINEGFLLVSVYMLHVFSDFVPEEITRYEFGWYYIYLVFFVFFMNIFIIGGVMLLDLYGMWRKYWKKRSLKRKIKKVLERRQRAKLAIKDTKLNGVVASVPNNFGLLASIQELPLEESQSSSSSEEESSQSSSELEVESVVRSLGPGARTFDEDIRPYGNQMRLLTSDSGEMLETSRPLLLSNGKTPGFESPLGAEKRQSVFFKQKIIKNYMEEELDEHENSMILIIEEEDIIEKASRKIQSMVPSIKNMPSSKFERLSLDSNEQDEIIEKPVLGSVQTLEPTPKGNMYSETTPKVKTNRSIQSVLLSPYSNPYGLVTERKSRRNTNPSSHRSKEEEHKEQSRDFLEIPKEQNEFKSQSPSSRTINRSSIKKLKRGMTDLKTICDRVNTLNKSDQSQDQTPPFSQERQQTVMQQERSPQSIKILSERSPTIPKRNPPRLFITSEESPRNNFPQPSPRGGITDRHQRQPYMTTDTYADSNKHIKFDQQGVLPMPLKESIININTNPATPWALDIPVPEGTPLHMYYPPTRMQSISPEGSYDRCQSVSVQSVAQSIHLLHPLPSAAKNSRAGPTSLSNYSLSKSGKPEFSPKILFPKVMASFVDSQSIPEMITESIEITDNENPITLMLAQGSIQNSSSASFEEEEKVMNHLSLQKNQEPENLISFPKQQQHVSPYRKIESLQNLHIMSAQRMASPNFDQIMETEPDVARRNTFAEPKRKKSITSSIGQKFGSKIQTNKNKIFINQACQILQSSAMSVASSRKNRSKDRK